MTDSGYAPVNGLQLYYEIRGSGAPLILLHGGLGSTESMAEVAEGLSGIRRVISVDLQAHGRTADSDRAFSYEAFADDIAGLAAHLGIARTDIMGYSLGGGVALRTAIQHPELIGKLVVVSFPFRRSGWYPEVLAAMDTLGPEAAERMKPSPIYQTYASNAPPPQDWARLVTKQGDLLRKEYDWSEEVKALRQPALLIFADADSVPPSHAVEFFELLGGGQRDAGWDRSAMPKSRLAIVPGFTHYDIGWSAIGPAVIAALSDPATDVA